MDINNDLPWVIFEISRQLYAVSTRLVTGIMSIPPVIRVANAPELFLGAVRVRGEVFPVLNTRKLLGCPSADKEAEAVIGILEENKEEHLRWMSLLRHCVESGKRFPMPLEATGCFFGRWYYDYVRKGSPYSAELKNAEAPHNEVHSLAKRIDALRGQDGEYDEAATELLEQAEKHSQKLVSCIDGISQSIRETLTPMIINLSFPSTRDTCMAFTVDSVKAVDEISMIDEKGNSKVLFVSGYLCGVGHNDKLAGELLLMDDLEIVKLVKLYHDSVKDQSPKKLRGEGSEEDGKEKDGESDKEKDGSDKTKEDKQEP
ncbi:MAG: chemotaxis protein CheW [Oscillospiraceae bacterium]|nr:chemotaxis protein CheW [Oscillospiraceae bacterium]